MATPCPAPADGLGEPTRRPAPLSERPPITKLTPTRPSRRGVSSTMTVVERFARNLRRIRTRRDLTPLDFAGRADMPRPAGSLLERGARGARGGALRDPGMETLIKLAGALEVPLSELVEGIEWQPFPSPPPPSAAGRFHFSQMERS